METEITLESIYERIHEKRLLKGDPTTFSKEKLRKTNINRCRELIISDCG